MLTLVLPEPLALSVWCSRPRKGCLQQPGAWRVIFLSERRTHGAWWGRAWSGRSGRTPSVVPSPGTKRSPPAVRSRRRCWREDDCHRPTAAARWVHCPPILVVCSCLPLSLRAGTSFLLLLFGMRVVMAVPGVWHARTTPRGGRVTPATALGHRPWDQNRGPRPCRGSTVSPEAHLYPEPQNVS